MFGWAVRMAVIWVSLGLVVYVAVNRLGPALQSAAAPPDSAVATAPDRDVATDELVFRANRQGHVFVDAEVDGAAVHFLVDTGATMLTLTTQDAAAAGITAGDLTYTMRSQTANGIARVAPVTLREVRIGQLTVRDVPAWVAENLGISLLGQSFLTRINGYEMRDGVLTLKYW